MFERRVNPKERLCFYELWQWVFNYSNWKKIEIIATNVDVDNTVSHSSHSIIERTELGEDAVNAPETFKQKHLKKSSIAVIF